MKIAANFSLPNSAFPKTPFRSVPNRFDRGEKRQRFELVNRGRGMKGLGSYQTIGADGNMLYLSEAGLTDDQTIHAIQTWLGSQAELDKFQAMVRAGLDAATAQRLFDNALTCTRLSLGSNLDGTCVDAAGNITTPSVHVSTPGNYTKPVAARPGITTRDISLLDYQAPPTLPSATQQGGVPASKTSPSSSPSSTSGGGANSSLTNPPGTSTGTSNQQQQQQQPSSEIPWVPMLVAGGVLFLMMQMGGSK